jgi:hypothetical protein
MELAARSRIKKERRTNEQEITEETERKKRFGILLCLLLFKLKQKAEKSEAEK